MSDDERWRKMTPTEREKNLPIIEECLQPLFDRIAELEAQITRLQAYVEELEFTIRGEYPYADEMITEDRAKYLHPGDLDPLGGDDELPR